MHSIKKYNINNHINVYYINDDKYKTVSMTIYVNRQLSRSEVTKNALIAKVLARGTSRYNTIESINTYLEGLYGTLYNLDVSKKANVQSIHCSVSNISDKYAGENVTSKAAELMLDFMFDPYLPGGTFDKDYVQGEKQNLKDDIDAIVNDKRSYANMRVIEEMCKGEDNAIMECGYIEDLADIDNDILYAHYKEIMFTSPIDIFVVGETDIDAIVNVIKDYLSKFSFDIKPLKINFSDKTADEIKYVEEAMSVNQGKLAIGLRTGINIENPMYYALLVGNSIFGAGAHSKLFNNVGEKLSLCYYASSR
ncbi:MAG: insulinase family protein, partial [Clostridia bacterium]|nr:insulinase family protein [Clostridia bacterium]